MTVKYLSQTDAAKRLGLTRQRVSALIKTGNLKAKDIAGRMVVSEPELQRFAAVPR
jgi:plasmid maintenance system antidote protein VapI